MHTLKHLEMHTEKSMNVEKLMEWKHSQIVGSLCPSFNLNESFDDAFLLRFGFGAPWFVCLLFSTEGPAAARYGKQVFGRIPQLFDSAASPPLPFSPSVETSSTKMEVKSFLQSLDLLARIVAVFSLCSLLFRCFGDETLNLDANSEPFKDNTSAFIYNHISDILAYLVKRERGQVNSSMCTHTKIRNTCPIYKGSIIIKLILMKKIT